MLTRRAFCSLLASLPALGGAAPLGVMRFSVLRYQTVLLEIAGRRVLFDPCFSRGLGAGPLLDAAAPALRPEDLGELDVLCVTAHEPAAFDPWATRALRSRTTSCLVADERTARVLRSQGFRRVRVMGGGDEVKTRDVSIRAGASQGALRGPGLAFHVERAGRSVLHVGAPPPLQDDGPLAAFARAHRAEVLLACAQGLTAFGQPVTFDDDDADVLAAACEARVVVRLGHDAHPTALGGLILSQAPVPRSRAGRASTARVVIPLPSTWYRVAPA